TLKFCVAQQRFPMAGAERLTVERRLTALLVLDKLVEVHELVAGGKSQARSVAVAVLPLHELEFHADRRRPLGAIVEQRSRATCFSNEPLQRRRAHQGNHLRVGERAEASDANAVEAVAHL